MPGAFLSEASAILGSCLTSKYLASLKNLANDKHASLFCRNMMDKEKTVL